MRFELEPTQLEIKDANLSYSDMVYLFSDLEFVAYFSTYCNSIFITFTRYMSVEELKDIEWLVETMKKPLK